MKKALCLSALLALALLLAGCTQDLPPGTAGDPWGLALTASEAGPTGCRLTYEQSGGKAAGCLQYGRAYHVEREEDGIWAALPFASGDDEVFWTLEAYEIARDSSHSVSLDWSDLYGELLPGRYRVCKEIMDFQGPGEYDVCNYYAEFEVE